MHAYPKKRISLLLLAAFATALPATASEETGANQAGSTDTGDKPGEFTISPERQQLIGVRYTKVEKTPLQGTLRAVGTVAAQTLRQWDYAARVDGYIHELFVAAPGDPVKKGQVLMDIYSPDLTATQNELLDLLRMRDAEAKDGSQTVGGDTQRLIASARARLRQWNVPDEEIDALEATRHAKQFLRLVSPVDGVVESLPARQGSHVSVGDPLVELVDLSAVWVWAEFYQEELPVLGPGVQVQITTSAYQGAMFTGAIGLVDPFADDKRRTSRVRIDVGNPDRRLRPGMYVDISLLVDQGVGLTVPVSAVLPTGRHNIVFVDKGEGRLEPRFIELGRKFGDRFAVAGGLAENERIVSSANFLIDAESKVQGALKDW